jgi:hypothetical protein
MTARAQPLAAVLAVLLLASAAAPAQVGDAQQELERARQRIEAEHAALRAQRVAFGAPMTVALYLGPDAAQSATIEVRPLYLRGNIERFTTGEPHDVDERYFVIRRAYRIDDAPSPDPRAEGLHWQWQRGGWLWVDRRSARVRDLNLPDFDPYYSEATWYRDYAAYCGLDREGQQVVAVIAQANKRRAILLQRLGPASGLPDPASECGPPQWSVAGNELRVTFDPRFRGLLTYALDGDKAELLSETPRQAQAR